MTQKLLQTFALSLLFGTSLQAVTNAPAVNPSPVGRANASDASEENPNPKNMVGLRISNPPGIKIEWDVPYLASDREEKCDLYLPTNSSAGKLRAAILIIHGGGFNDGDKARGREINFCTNLAVNGYVCMSINYKLSRPNARQIPTWPQSLYDAKTAVRWLRKNAERLQVDPNRIAAMGGSAGGNLSAMLATTGPKDGLEPTNPYAEFSTRVSCAVDFYGAVKLMDYHDMKMFSKTRAEAPELYEKASPVNYVDKGDAPMMVVHGTADPLVLINQSEALANAFKKAGAECEFVVVPEGPHSFNLEPRQKELRSLILRFFAKYLRAG